MPRLDQRKRMKREPAPAAVGEEQGVNSAGLPLPIPSSGQNSGDGGVSDAPGSAGQPTATGSNGQPAAGGSNPTDTSGSGSPNPSSGPGDGDGSASGSGTLTAPPGSSTGFPGGTGVGASDSNGGGAGGSVTNGSGSSTLGAGSGNGNGNGGGNGNGNGNGGGNGNGNGNGSGNGNGNGNGNGSSSAPGVPGSGGGDVNGPGSSGRHGLSPAAITAILLAILLVLAILVLGGRLLWRRRRERRLGRGVQGLSTGRPEMYSQTSFAHDPQLAERLRGGLIEPYTGAASAETLPSMYRVEPFAVPPRRPPHARTPSSMRLLDDAADMPGVGGTWQNEKSAPLAANSSLPRGAMNLGLHGHTYSELAFTPMATPALEEEEMVFELPPTYASLNQPQPIRRWYNFWQT